MTKLQEFQINLDCEKTEFCLFLVHFPVVPQRAEEQITNPTEQEKEGILAELTIGG